jgi:hypothetical protein
VKTFALVAVLVVLGWYALGSPWPNSGRSMHDLQEQVAEDQVRQWMAVSKDPNHTLAEVCIHAQLVADAYLQAGDDDQYHKWEKNAKDECPEGTR